MKGSRIAFADILTRLPKKYRMTKLQRVATLGGEIDYASGEIKTIMFDATERDQAEFETPVDVNKNSDGTLKNGDPA